MGGRWALPGRDRAPAARTLSAHTKKEIETKEMNENGGRWASNGFNHGRMFSSPSGRIFVDQSEKFLKKKKTKGGSHPAEAGSN